MRIFIHKLMGYHRKYEVIYNDMRNWCGLDATLPVWDRVARFFNAIYISCATETFFALQCSFHAVIFAFILWFQPERRRSDTVRERHMQFRSANEPATSVPYQLNWLVTSDSLMTVPRLLCSSYYPRYFAMYLDFVDFRYKRHDYVERTNERAQLFSDRSTCNCR